MKKIYKFLLFITVIAVSTSCEKGSNYSKSIVGEWQGTSIFYYRDGKKIYEETLDYHHYPDYDIVWSFSAGGEFQVIRAYHFPSKEVIAKGNYSVQGKELKLTAVLPSMTIEKLTSSDLVLSNMEDDGTKMEHNLEKIK